MTSNDGQLLRDINAPQPTSNVAPTGGLSGIVLAAGAGTRYGGPKILAHGGEWLRSAVAALVGGGCDEVIVVMGAAVVDAPAPARAVVVPNWHDGMATSLRAGLAAATAAHPRAVIITLVDLPDVGAEVVRRVSTAADRHTLARATFGGVPGHPVVIGAEWMAQVSGAVTGDRGAGHFLRQQRATLIECGDLATGQDIDSRHYRYL